MMYIGHRVVLVQWGLKANERLGMYLGQERQRMYIENNHLEAQEEDGE
jgi:hypothetical protein